MFGLRVMKLYPVSTERACSMVEVCLCMTQKAWQVENITVFQKLITKYMFILTLIPYCLFFFSYLFTHRMTEFWCRKNAKGETTLLINHKVFSLIKQGPIDDRKPETRFHSAALHPFVTTK